MDLRFLVGLRDVHGQRDIYGQRICHADLHCDNVFLHEGRALLADFGDAHPATPLEDRKDLPRLILRVTFKRASVEIKRLREIVDKIRVEGDDNQLLTTAIDTLKRENDWLLD